VIEWQCCCDVAHDWQLQKLADKKLLVALHVGHHDLQEIVGLASHEMASDHFGHGGHGMFEVECTIIGVAIDLHGEEDREAETNAVAMKNGTISGDNSFVSQSSHPPQARRCGKPYAVSQLKVGQSRVRLQFWR
jgi:hypothetical protein